MGRCLLFGGALGPLRSATFGLYIACEKKTDTSRTQVAARLRKKGEDLRVLWENQISPARALVRDLGTVFVAHEMTQTNPIMQQCYTATCTTVGIRLVMLVKVFVLGTTGANLQRVGTKKTASSSWSGGQWILYTLCM